jgi:hypothetical protein
MYGCLDLSSLEKFLRLWFGTQKDAMEKRYKRRKPDHNASRELWQQTVTTTNWMETTLRREKSRWHQTWYVSYVRDKLQGGSWRIKSYQYLTQIRRPSFETRPMSCALVVILQEPAGQPQQHFGREREWRTVTVIKHTHYNPYARQGARPNPLRILLRTA